MKSSSVLVALLPLTILSPTTHGFDSTRDLSRASSCSDGSTGYATWEAMAQDALELDITATTTMNEILQICPGTTLVPGDNEAIILTNSMEVRCGQYGNFEDNCIVSGGTSHFIIAGESANVNFYGISFREASNSSIRALADPDSSVKFQDCEFYGNEGDDGSAAVDVRSQLDGARAVSTAFESCNFVNNESYHGVLSVRNASATVNKCKFHSNSLGGAIVTYFESDLTLSQSCFTENDSEGDGIISISGDTSQYHSSGNNYGRSNNAHDCETVSIGNDGGVTICLQFETLECISEKIIGAPSAAPILPPPSSTETDGPTPAPGPKTSAPTLYLFPPPVPSPAASCNSLSTYGVILFCAQMSLLFWMFLS